MLEYLIANGKRLPASKLNVICTPSIYCVIYCSSGSNFISQLECETVDATLPLTSYFFIAFSTF